MIKANVLILDRNDRKPPKLIGAEIEREPDDEPIDALYEQHVRRYYKRMMRRAFLDGVMSKEQYDFFIPK
jgi:hypothetical protein